MFFFFFKHHIYRSGMPNRSMLGDRALVFLNQRGRDIKLQYNIFTNIISHVKKYIAYKNNSTTLSTYSVFRRRNTVLMAL